MDEGPYRVRQGQVPSDLCHVERVLADPATCLLKDSARVAVARRRVGGRELVLKRFREGSPLQLAESLFVGSGAARVWHAARLMRGAGFAVPASVATLERRRAGLVVASCAVTEWVAGTPLDDLWRARHGAARRAVTLGFADYLRRLHAAGLYPQDLRAANVVVSDAEPLRFVLVDLDRVRRYRRLSWPRRRKNLVQVHRSVGRGAPPREALTFLRRYLGDPARAELHRVAAEIVGLGRRKDAEYSRRRGGVPRERRGTG